MASVIVALSAGADARAQVLVTRQYGIEAGLANNTVGSAFQDSRGYLWFATAEGLSRFDGRAFVNYGTADGLPHEVVREAIEDKWGHLWVATVTGLARLVDGQAIGRASDRFVAVPLGVRSAPHHLQLAPDGAIWCLTDDHGALKGYPDRNGSISFTVVVPGPSILRDPAALHVDARGRVWITLADAVLVVDGSTEHRVPLPGPLGGGAVLASSLDGRVYFARGNELYEMAGDTWSRLPVRLPAGAWISSILVDRRDLIWLGTSQGVFGWRRGAYSDEPLRGATANTARLIQDSQQNLWATSYGRGVFKVGRELVVEYETGPLLGVDPVNRIVEDDSGRIYAITLAGAIAGIKGNAVRVLARGVTGFDTVYRRVHLDRRGRWWALTEQGLFYNDGPRQSNWKRVGSYRADPIQNPLGPALVEDGSKHLWLGAIRDALYRLDLNSGTLEPRPVPTSNGFVGFAAHMAVDRGGNLWMADNAHLRRLRGAAVEDFEPRPGLPETRVRTLYQDARGWIWVGLRFGGVVVIKNPDADRPVFENYTTAHGLRSNAVHAITADKYGRMYFTTGRGLDRFDPADGRVRHYDELAGASASVSWLMTARDGHVWAATDGGLVRLDPDVDRDVARAPPVYFTRVEAGGEPVAIAARSVAQVSGIVIAPSRNTVTVEFASVGFDAAPPRYQYRLDGVNREWSAPTTTRVVDYPRLPAGGYRFEVRSLNERDQPSAPAVATFTVLPPFWRTWWFAGLVIGFVSMGGGLAYRQRLLRRRGLERVRQQVAQDLHDEVGSGLAQIAVLSEVAKRSSGAADPTLTDIADVARDLRDSMTDIIWAVDPRRDSFADLVARMRQIASNLFEADGVDFVLHAPPHDAIKGIDMPPDRRRHLLLVFKEAMTNAARHARAKRVAADVAVAGGQVTLVIEDNGRGFDASATHAGSGVVSMRQRAAELGGTIAIQSGKLGTRIELRARLRA